jgi:hypothetical protein
MERIVHYNPSKLWDHSDLRQKYIDLKLDNDFPFIDRSESLPHFLPVVPYSKPVEYDESFNHSFYDICCSQSLIILGFGKKVNIFWSGGLDSTVALVSFLVNAKDRNQIRILANYNSIIESGYVYDTFFKKINCVIETDIGKSLFKEDELYITGSPGNQLFHYGSKTPYLNANNEKEIEFVYPSLLKSPKPIETLEDYNWFRNYMFKWDHQRFAILNKWTKEKNLKKYINCIDGFYYNKLFEQWSIHNREQDPNTPKLPMRIFLKKVLGKEINDYANKKMITNSIFLPFNQNYNYVTENLEANYDNPLSM